MARHSRLKWPTELKHTAIRDRWFKKFASLKPGLSLQQAAKKLRQSYTSVYRWAQMFRYDFPDLRRQGRVSDNAWDDVDWTLRDAEIARELEVSRERVRQVRANRKMGPSAHRLRVQKFARWINSNHKKLNGVAVSQVIRAFGGNVSLQVARRLLRNAGVEPHDPGSRWRGVDWRLPNRELARLWNASPKYVANIRARLKVGAAKFKLTAGMLPGTPAFKKALAEEQKKVQNTRKQRRSM